MNSRITGLGILAVVLWASAARAAEKAAGPDLSSPVTACEAFLKACKAGDLVALKATVSPRQWARIAAGGDAALADWARLWANSGIRSVDGAGEPTKEGERTTVFVRLTLARVRDGAPADKQAAVRFTLEGKEWRMDEN